MTMTIDAKGRITIPKRTRRALKLEPGSHLELAIKDDAIVLYKAGGLDGTVADRFERARGAAQIKWRTEDLMALLRGGD
jgi:antitoxin PrlF